MSLIAKEEKKNRVHMQARIADHVAAELELYCRFLESRTDYVVENLLAFAFKRDREFQDWLAANQHDSVPETTTAARRRASTTEAA